MDINANEKADKLRISPILILNTKALTTGAA